MVAYGSLGYWLQFYRTFSNDRLFKVHYLNITALLGGYACDGPGRGGTCDLSLSISFHSIAFFYNHKATTFN